MTRLARAVATCAVFWATLPIFCQTTQGIVTTALKLRKGAGTHTARITTLYPGTKVEILDTDGGWYHVRTASGRDGWVKGDHVRTPTRTSPRPSAPAYTDAPSRPALANPPSDEWYRGVIPCAWVEGSPVNARALLGARRISITRIDHDCDEPQSFVLIAFGSEVPLGLLQEVIRAFSNVPHAEIEPLVDSQYPGAIRIGLYRGDGRSSAQLSNVAGAILALHGDETADELQTVRQYIFEQRRKPR